MASTNLPDALGPLLCIIHRTWRPGVRKPPHKRLTAWSDNALCIGSACSQHSRLYVFKWSAAIHWHRSIAETKGQLLLFFSSFFFSFFLSFSFFLRGTWMINVWGTASFAFFWESLNLLCGNETQKQLPTNNASAWKDWKLKNMSCASAWKGNCKLYVWVCGKTENSKISHIYPCGKTEHSKMLHVPVWKLKSKLYWWVCGETENSQISCSYLCGETENSQISCSYLCGETENSQISCSYLCGQDWKLSDKL